MQRKDALISNQTKFMAPFSPIFDLSAQEIFLNKSRIISAKIKSNG
jgi:hypothetical protein